MPRAERELERFTAFDHITRPLVRFPHVPSQRVRVSYKAKRGTITWLGFGDEQELRFGPINDEHITFTEMVKRFFQHIIPEAHNLIEDVYDALYQRFSVEKVYPNRGQLIRIDEEENVRNGTEWRFTRSNVVEDGLTVELTNKRLSSFRLIIRSTTIDLRTRVLGYDNFKGF